MELISVASSSAFLAAVGTNVGTTFASLSGLVAAVVGVVLAIKLGSYLISLFKKAIAK